MGYCVTKNKARQTEKNEKEGKFAGAELSQ